MEKHRKIGEGIPDWSKRGPVSVENYNWRAEHYGVIKNWGDKWPFLSRNQDIPGTADEQSWDRYFRDHLGGFPESYQLYRDGVIRYFNVPEALPDVFDPTFNANAIRARSEA